MGTLTDASRFLELSVLAVVVYVLYGAATGHDVDVLPLGLFLAGALALVFVAHRFSEDFGRDPES